jgi:hypothetical protein
MTFLRHTDFSVIPKQLAEELPIISVQSVNLSETLSQFLAMDEWQLNKLQRDGVRYATQWHNPEKIAREYAQHYFSRI